MKISILTATYNREKHLKNLYNSLLENSKYDVNLEWLIMDDGSEDGTKELVKNFINGILDYKNFEIKYYYQENQGKMSAINNLMKYVANDSSFLIECDSDDYLLSNAIETIKEKSDLIKDKNNIYALCLLKNDKDMQTIGSKFKNGNYTTTMFDLYFKDGIIGDKALVFNTKIRKQYKYKLEKNEKFVTEARMFNEMDKKYNIVCFNAPIMVCEYLEHGYSKNAKKLFLENSYGYYEYFKQILNFDMKGVIFSKRLYAIKHYILFSYLTKQKNLLKQIKGILNKLLLIVLYVPGVIKSIIYKKRK